MNKARDFRQELRGQLDSLGKAQALRLLATVTLACAALALAGCAGGSYYETGYSSGYYAPDYGPYYGEYGYAGGPYGGYGGSFGGPDIIVGTSHYHHSYGQHHFAAERGVGHRAPAGGGHFSHGGSQHAAPGRSH